jgi:anti-anti-sigma factor
LPPRPREAAVLRFEVRERPHESVVVWLSGDLTGEEWTDRLLDFLEEHYVNDGVRLIVLDVGQVSEIDLEGVGTLVRLKKESGARGKEFIVRQATGQVQARLELTGLLDWLSKS